MKLPTLGSSPLLNWVLQQGLELLTFQVDRTGARYRVSVSSPGSPKRLYSRVCAVGSDALQLHAALVADFREAGWTSVSYR
jgi:hypothetical protein